MCLRCSLYWTLLVFVMVYVLQPAAAWLYRMAGPFWHNGGWQLAVTVLLADVGWTVFRSARGLRPAAK